MRDSLAEIKKACASLFSMEGEGLGSGYLITPEMVATCAHVVCPVGGEGARVLLRFPWGDRQGTVSKVDPICDSALIEIEKAPDWLNPLRRAVAPPPRGARWLAYGFPRIARSAEGEPTGLVIEGEIRDPEAKDTKGSPALQLYSYEISAGRGAKPHGLSGSPVLVGGRVAGHLKRIIPESFDEPRAELGVVFACPIGAIKHLGALPGDTSRRYPQPPGAPYDPTWYVHRAKEDMALSNLEYPGVPVILWGPEQFGKTTLIRYLLDRSRDRALLEGKKLAVFVIDLSMLMTGINHLRRSGISRSVLPGKS